MQLDSATRKTVWYAVQGGSALIGAVWFTIPDAAQWLLIAMTFDILTGMLAAGRKQLWSSKGMAPGLKRKAAELLLVSVLFYVDRKNGTVFGSGTAFWFVGKEAGSIVENLALLGVPIPPSLRKRLKIFTDQTEADASEVQHETPSVPAPAPTASQLPIVPDGQQADARPVVPPTD